MLNSSIAVVALGPINYFGEVVLTFDSV